MRVSLVTVGDPHQQTGGYLYHRRLAEAAPRHDAEMAFVSFPQSPFPLATLRGRGIMASASEANVVVIDSIAAAVAAPWLRDVDPSPLGMLHQRPGGIDHGPLRTRLQAVLDRRAYAGMRALLVASQSLADEMRGSHHDIRVVPPGRDVATVADPEVNDLRAGHDAAFLCVGNWVPRKGIVELLDAFARLPEGAATLHLVGDEHIDRRYAAKVRRRLDVLGSRVVMHGVVARERVAAFYRDADVFVMPSMQEPYGTVYAEAMAAGLPVVGWRAGNLPYLAEDGREALILEPRDVDALAAALQLLANDATLRQEIGQAAQVRARTFPTWAQTAARFFTELRSL